MFDFDVMIIGGGAGGFYGAIHMAGANPRLKIAILEKSRKVLSKVKVSGGGRCNVTHAQFDARELSKNYPRGHKELLGPFHTHHSGDTVTFFEERGIPLKTEGDGRMFPVSDSSQTIIDCFLTEINNLGVTLIKNSPVTDLIPGEIHSPDSPAGWIVCTDERSYTSEKVLLATGSSIKIWNILNRLGYRIEPPVPSLFTFNINDDRIKGLQGISTFARVEIVPWKVSKKEITTPLRSSIKKASRLMAEGPVLITHWGMSGPAILKLSAWGALVLNEYLYRFNIRVNWLPDYHREGVLTHLQQVKEIESRKTVLRTNAVDLPRRLWIKLVQACGISRDTTWNNLTKPELGRLVSQLTRSEFTVDGKSTFKEEFVTAGGVDLKEINFRTFESRRHPNLYFAGEVLNIDALTGGFNFQNAWTGAYLAAKAIVGNHT